MATYWFAMKVAELTVSPLIHASMNVGNQW